MQTKYIVVLGSMMSGLGKGVVTSSLLKMLDFYDYKALPIKFDGYLNYDCGTMNPYRHGEVFVLDDKSEVDMDFGIYERFSNLNLTGDLSITGGKLFGSVISKERRGEYLGEDVQIIPHLTNEAISMIEKVEKKRKPDVIIIEVGGTVGDIENSYFIEAVRQLALKHPTLFINLTYAPSLEVVGEQKTKPAQVGYRLLLQAGIRPDFVICRSRDPLNGKARSKLAMFANISEDKVIDDSDADTIYELPLHFMQQNFDKKLLKALGFSKRLNRRKYNSWKSSVSRIKNPKNSVEIGVLGKYTDLKDSYASVKEALVHAGASLDTGVKIRWIESSDLEREGSKNQFEGLNGILVPGGFGNRGIEGMIRGIEQARKNHIPYLGLCLGMQLMAVEYARNVANLKGANSTEFDPKTKYDIIHLLPSQKGVESKGGTMRLGLWKCRLSNSSRSRTLYGSSIAGERHRHRYEFNNKYRKNLEAKGLLIAGTTLDGKLVEFIEWKDSFGIATQSHPELRSRLESPAPLFKGFIDAALSDKRSQRKTSA
jgi:CTP synthase